MTAAASLRCFTLSYSDHYSDHYSDQFDHVEVWLWCQVGTTHWGVSDVFQTGL